MRQSFGKRESAAAGQWRLLSKSPLKLMLGVLVFFCILLICFAKQYLEANFARKTVTELQLRLRDIEKQVKAESEATDQIFQRVVGDVKSITRYVKSLDADVKQNQQLRGNPGGFAAFPTNAITYKHTADDKLELLTPTPPVARPVQPLMPSSSPVAGKIGQHRGGGVATLPILASPQGVRSILFPGVTVVIMFCFGRPQYLNQALKSLTSRLREQVTLQKSRDDGELSAPNSFLVVLSQDGDERGISDILDEALKVLISIDGVDSLHLHHPRTPIVKRKTNAYMKLADHFRWALNKVFDPERDSEINSRLAGTPDRVIILEDDMLLAIDFFEYMGAMSTILDRDPSVMAISAWNDHGQIQYVNDNQALVRSDFFPGLGWMTTRNVWEQIEPKWPTAYWDDWLREPEQRRDRQFIHPEVSRTYTIGKTGGASKGQFFKKYLGSMRLNDKFVAFTEKDMSSLDAQTYHNNFNAQLERAVEIQYTKNMDLQAYQSTGVIIKYHGARAYKVLCKSLGILPDVKSGVPRGAYEGIVSISIHNTPVFLLSETVISKEEQREADIEAERAARRRPSQKDPKIIAKGLGGPKSFGAYKGLSDYKGFGFFGFGRKT